MHLNNKQNRKFNQINYKLIIIIIKKKKEKQREVMAKEEVEKAVR